MEGCRHSAQALRSRQNLREIRLTFAYASLCYKSDFSIRIKAVTRSTDLHKSDSALALYNFLSTFSGTQLRVSANISGASRGDVLSKAIERTSDVLEISLNCSRPGVVLPRRRIPGLVFIDSLRHTLLEYPCFIAQSFSGAANHRGTPVTLVKIIVITILIILSILLFGRFFI